MKITHYLLILFTALLLNSCVDNDPVIEELPNPDIAFNYSVIDAEYQIDYYVGANIEFVSSSFAAGECTWDFGDGTIATGQTVTHKYKTAGTYTVKLTIANAGYQTKPILISDIKPIVSLNKTGLIEVVSTSIGFNVELPNPEKLTEEYHWVFPDGTLGATGHVIATIDGKNPGNVTFSNIGSQVVTLQVKLGGRQLEDGVIKVPVAYNIAVPTLYYAVKGGNIMALKLATNPPAGMKINPFDMGTKSGQHPLNILFSDTSLYVLDCGRQFTFVDDKDGNLGDGRIIVMSKDGAKVETMMTNIGAAFNDPYYGYIDGGQLYFSDRNTGFSAIGLKERNRTFSRTDYPYYVENATLGYYGQGISYGAMNACFGKINNVWYWCKTYNGNGIFRFTDADILKIPITGNGVLPTSGIALESMTPKSFVWDPKNSVFYFTLYDTGYEGLYRCTLAQLNEIGGNKEKLVPYRLKLANGKTVTPVTETGKGEGSTGEFIAICQLALDENDGCDYFGLRSGDSSVKSGLMRYNPSTGFIEYVIEGVDVYGVAVNKTKSKLF